MTLLDTLKSLLGLESKDRRIGEDDDVGVTVEREAGEETEPAPVSSPSVDTEPDDAADTGDGDDPTDAEHTEEEADAEPGEEAEADEAEAEAEQADEVEPPEEDAGDVEADDEPAGTDEPTDVIEGIGPAYSERLASAGIETVADLAAADAEAVAEQVDGVGTGRLETWIERANDR